MKHYEGRRYKVSLHFIAEPMATLEHCMPIAHLLDGEAGQRMVFYDECMVKGLMEESPAEFASSVSAAKVFQDSTALTLIRPGH